MSLDDWTEQQGASNQKQSNNYAYEGSYSWVFGSEDVSHILTYDPSGSDAPKEARVDTRIYAVNAGDSGRHLGGPIFRYKDDSNYYAVVLSPSSDEATLALIKNGSFTDKGKVSIPHNVDTWDHIDIETYVDSGGAFNARVRMDTDGDGNLETQGTIADGNNEFSAGGAVGLGTIHSYSGSSSFDPVHFDETSVYY